MNTYKYAHIPTRELYLASSDSNRVHNLCYQYKCAPAFAAQAANISKLYYLTREYHDTEQFRFVHEIWDQDKQLWVPIDIWHATRDPVTLLSPIFDPARVWKAN